MTEADCERYSDFPMEDGGCFENFSCQISGIAALYSMRTSELSGRPSTSTCTLARNTCRLFGASRSTSGSTKNRDRQESYVLHE